jgi:hypothetical protein
MSSTWAIHRHLRCELVTGRSIEVIQAGRSVHAGRSRSTEDYAVAALCCCTVAVSLTIKCQLPMLAGEPFLDCQATKAEYR